jgi:hypothetical protein
LLGSSALSLLDRILWARRDKHLLAEAVSSVGFALPRKPCGLLRRDLSLFPQQANSTTASRKDG